MVETSNEHRRPPPLNTRKGPDSTLEDISENDQDQSSELASPTAEPINNYPSFISLDRKEGQRKKPVFPDFESTRSRAVSGAQVPTADSTASLSSASFRETDDSTIADQTHSSKYIGQRVSPSWALADILQVLGDKHTFWDELIDKTNDLVELLEENKSLQKDLVFSSVLNVIQRLLLSDNETVVACGYRILRYVLTDVEDMVAFNRWDLHFFIIASLSRDYKRTTERRECLMLIGQIVEIENGLDEFSIGYVRSLVNMMESTSDPLRHPAFELLVKVSILNPKVAYQANAITALLHYIIDGPVSSIDIFGAALLKLLELPTTRPYIIESQIIQLLVSPFMDISHIKVENLQIIAHLIALVLKNWSGLIAFSQEDFKPLRELISCLTFASTSIKNILLQLFFDLFRIKTMSWTESEDTHPAITLLQESSKPNTASKSTVNTRSSPETEVSPVNHHTALLLHICIKCGLVDRLKSMFEETTDKKQSKRVMVLLSEISYMQSFLVPEKLTVSIAPSFELNKQIELDLRKHHTTNLIVSDNARVKASEKLSKDLRLKMLRNVDAAELKNLVSNTHVLATKDYYKWNWALITELMQGPLQDSRNFEETAKTTKFYKRLMSFYRPFKYRFSSLRKTKSNLVFVKVGCEIFKNLLSNAEGVKYLTENKILPQIAECLAQVDPHSGITASDPLFSKAKLENTISYGYFSFLGVLSADPNGLRMLEQWWFFDMLYHITDHKSERPDLVRVIVKEMKYNANSHMRIILNKVANTSNTSLRLYSVKLLSTLLEAEECEKFACESLVGQLCDPEVQIRDLAVEYLTSFAKDEDKIIEIIKHRPSVDVLGSSGVTLMLMILSTRSGFEYLQECDFVDMEMEAWIQTKNKLYVDQIETYLAHKFYNEPVSGDLPYHFFGELVRTIEGLHLFENTGTFDSFCGVVSSYLNLITSARETEYYEKTPINEQEDFVADLKSVLWAIGHIGSSDYGISLLEISGVVEDIATICKQSQNASIKGTCFFVLGLISRTELGSEMLDDVGWYSNTGRTGDQGVCLPKHLTDFLYVDKTDGSLVDLETVPESAFNDDFDRIMEQDFVPYHNNQKTLTRTNSLSMVTGGLGTNNVHSTIYSRDYQILKQLYNNLLLLPVNQGKAIGNLNKLKARFATIFESEPVVLKLIMRVVEKYRVKYGVKRFLLGELIDFNSLMELLLRHHRKRSKDFPSSGMAPQLEPSKSVQNITSLSRTANRRLSIS
ncbi:hypothetical protein OGAPHI_002265 [Ogataea philodendri]|uniref:Uncharacterized protein n=1 Tax=Ogataea philodendri TaxID=1378263 RepID=A0A9P8T808_9ASCO|nr:uncharacterized protein OGAPHI_002265 [Ogataea philodendri]KAH3668511.1 hypothetical protein OGAPHI_002265 [Ogataea philodendri]